MPRPRPPYLHRYHTRHDKFYWYVRKPGGKRIRIRAEFGTPEFDAQYQAAIAGQKMTATTERTKARSGSLKWLWDRYRETSAWAALSSATRRQRENIMVHVLASGGQEPCDDIKRNDIAEGRDRRAATPAQARNFLDCMRGLFGWAAEAGHVSADPTIGVKNPKKRKTAGFPPWNENDVEAYQKKWAIGTKERVWLDMLLYTGPRRGDVVQLGRQHVRKHRDPKTGRTFRVMTFKTEKGGKTIEVSVPILDVLERTLAAGPCADLAFICGAKGEPLTKESFGNMFSAAARKAGIVKSAHGVRKIAATTAADNGATVHQLMAIFGWKTSDMAEFYTREANRRRLAREAMHMLERTAEEHSMCQPDQEVGTSGEISE